MYQCKYCGRYLKSEYDNCPGCGSTHFQKVNNNGVMKITTVPQGGYKINYNNMKKDNLSGIVFIIAGIIFFPLGALSTFTYFGFDILINTTEESFDGINSLFYGLILTIIGMGLLYFGIKAIIEHKEKMKKLKQLIQIGVLIKNLPYDVKPTGIIINGRSIYCIEVMYELDNGTKIPLTSEGKYDGRLSRGDGTVDLLIDPTDHTNYFIDFEIY